MPIDIDRFEEGPEEALRAGGPTNAEQILTFLGTNAEQAFTPKEIHEATDIPRGSVGTVLSRLEERGHVRHRGEYWAIDDEVEVEKTLTAMSTARAATDRFGPEDPDEWGPGVESEDG
jgi:predicted transcriptional regulator of viral defense system